MAVHTPFRSHLSAEEKIGVVVAIALHAGLVGWLALAPARSTFQPPLERMTVSLSDEIAPEATAPEPLAQAAPETAPTLGEAASEPEPEPLPEVVPEPQPRVVASPLPRPAPPVARPVPKPTPRPVAKPVAKPSQRPAPPIAKPVAKTPAKPAVKPVAKASTPADTRTRRRPDTPSGASRVGTDFLRGIPGGETRGAAQTPPAARAGPQVAASLAQAISRALKPRWNAPQGAEADQLVTVLAFDLNADGSLAGRPKVVSQSGVTDANSAQKARHAEQAIRAVQLAAPFDLPAQYYPLWKRVTSFRFDRRLSQ